MLRRKWKSSLKAQQHKPQHCMWKAGMHLRSLQEGPTASRLYAATTTTLVLHRGPSHEPPLLLAGSRGGPHA